jgi:hypothetical protein
MVLGVSPLAAVAALRAQAWDAGFRPVAIYNPDAPVAEAQRGKAPKGDAWQIRARANPPEAAVAPPEPDALNTGLLCDGLRAVDLDIDNPTLAAACMTRAIKHLGEAPVRSRSNSPRCLLFYRAAEGEPAKLTLAGRLGKIEVLGRGQQFVAWGKHPSGAMLRWFPEAPGDIGRDSLPAVTEKQIATFLADCAPIINATPPQPVNGANHTSSEPQADRLRIAAALAAIANDGPADWEAWNRVGMALWAATGAAELGRLLWHEWSARNDTYAAEEAEQRWKHYAKSPPTSIGAGTLFHIAAEATRPVTRDSEQAPGWEPGADRDEDEQPAAKRILSGSTFMNRHTPSVWLIQGIVQRSRLYACTSLTGHGKTAIWLFNACMIHAGRMIGSHRGFQGNVLILAGENPTDLAARMIGMARHFNIPHETLPFVLPETFPLSQDGAEQLRLDIDNLGIPFALIVGDTASSFFPGDDENSNVQAGGYARTARTLTECHGNPAVILLSHPVKNASKGNLLPRGGSAFLNELDGNLSIWSDDPGVTAELHWSGKIRGADFAPLGYRLRTVKTGLADEHREPEITVIAEPMSDEELADHGKQILAAEDAVLIALRDHPEWSMNQIARDRGWLSDNDTPLRMKVLRILRRLGDERFAEQPRKGAPWKITEKGRRALEDTD